MGNFTKLFFALVALSPVLLSSLPVKKPIILEPIKIQAMACNKNLDSEMHQILGWGQAYQISPDCRSPSTRQTDIALHTFYSSWIQTFGDLENKVEQNLRQMIIVYSREDMSMTAYTEDGVLVHNAEVVGVTSSKDYIWVSIRDSGNRICNTSFVHELVHASIWAIKGIDGDPDHLGAIYSGWTSAHSELIHTVNKKLCMLGL